MANEAALQWQGQNAGQENEDRQGKNNPIDTGKNVINGVNNAAKKGKKAYDTLKKAKTAIQAARTTAMLANPWVWVVVGVIVIVLIFIIIMFHFSGSSESEDDNSGMAPTTTGPGGPVSAITIPGLTISLSGPTEINNGQDIEYTVSYTYDVSVGKTPIENVALVDAIPINAIFVSTDGIQAADSTSKIVTWSLKDPVNQKPFKIILHPIEDDIYVTNSVSARLAAGSGSSPQEFRDLIMGQGRNMAVLGNKNSFISTIMTNSSGLPLSGKESYLAQIYDAGAQYNINPLILTSIWGVENGFDPTPDYPFGCLSPIDKGFTENSTCAAGSLNQLMAKFETQSIGGSLEIPSTTGNTCIYSDAFDYAYEMYTPVCHANDGNDPARANFISFYKKFKGI